MVSENKQLCKIGTMRLTEDLLINKNNNGSNLAQMREQLNAKLSEVSQAASEVERIARQNEIIRRENEQLREVVEPNPTGNGSVFAAGSLKTTYTFDPLGRLTQSDQGGQLRKFKYDSLGRLTRQKLAEQSATLNDSGAYVGSGTWSEAFIYDSRSNLIQKTDPRGVRTNISYQVSGADDPLNRIQSRSYDLSGPLEGS